MARDRDRARRRRAERKGEGAPDPLDHASSEVDEARLAERGAVPPRRDGDDDLGAEIFADELAEDRVGRADDAVEGDAVSRHELDRGGPRRTRGRFITFLGHVVDELRRVQWPNRRHVGQATAVVLGFVVLAGGYLGLLDALWQPLIEAIL